MTREKALMIQDRINNGTHNAHIDAAITADINESTVNDFDIEVKPHPLNQGNSFHHMELVVDIARGFDVHTYATIVDDTIHVILF